MSGPHVNVLVRVCAAEARAATAPGPWLAWAPGDCGAEDERWARRLAALLHLRRLPAVPPAGQCHAQSHTQRRPSDSDTRTQRRPLINTHAHSAGQ